MDESSNTQSSNLFASKMELNKPCLENRALCSPKEFFDNEFSVETSDQQHSDRNSEKWEILLDKAPGNQTVSAEKDVILDHGRNFSPVRKPLMDLLSNSHHHNNDHEQDERKLLLNDLMYQTPNQNVKKSFEHSDHHDAFNTHVNFLSKSTTAGTDKMEFEIQQHEVELYQPDPELIIQIDVNQVSKSYEEYAKVKVPQYIKKLQKHIKKINHILKHFDLEKEGLQDLKKEVRDLRNWGTSWTYSRILLYLSNLLSYFKYKHQVDRKSFKKKTFKKALKLAKKSYFYVRQTIKALCITFNPEEIEVFERLKEEYASFIHQKSLEVQDIKEDSQEEKEKKLNKKRKHSKNEVVNESPKKIKKLKLEDEEFDIQPEVEEEEEDDLWTEFRYDRSRKDRKPKRNFIGIKDILNKKRKKKRKLQSDQEDFEAVKAALELDDYFNKLSSYYKSAGHVGEIYGSVFKSFKDESLLKEKEVVEIVKCERSAPVIWKEIDQHPSLNLPSLNFPTLNISKPKNIPYISKLPVFSSFSENSENIEIEEEPVFTKAQSQPLLSSIFATENKSIQNIQVDRKVHLHDIGRLFDENYKRKTTALLFTDSISQKLHGYMRLKGIDYKLSTDQIDHEVLKKIVLLRFEFKLDEDDGEESQTRVELNIRNTLSIESFNNFVNVSDHINKEEFALREYSDLFKPEQMIKKLFGVVCAHTILDQLSTDPWKFDPSSALYYYSQLRQDEEDNDYYEVGVLTLVENFFDFHIKFNDKQLF